MVSQGTAVLGADEFAAWFRLLESPGVGPAALRRLLAACGSAPAVLACDAATLREIAGAAASRALAIEPPEYSARLQAALAWLGGGADRQALTLGDPRYPAALLQTTDPPPLLYVQGDVACLSRPSIAIVGSRHCTPQGDANARAFAAALGQAGQVIVSGLALGIDAAAHEGALQAGAATIAVVGTGLDRVYPARHRALAHRIAAQGALVSEFSPGMPPLADNFPRRNRIIAGLTQGTLVVEAALQSGSLITARLASEAGREVFAMPGSIHAPQSRGCHALLKQGAKLVETAQDILEELLASPVAAIAGPNRGTSGAAGKPAPEPAADPLLAALGHDPVTLDALISRTGWPAHELSAKLMELELEGRVSRLPGGLYQRLFIG
ncbi:MAG: DNA-processing protein DprA [Rubrivivax sp.]|nr:DNA-processing protein DprA [Rubrivivax sp.]